MFPNSCFESEYNIARFLLVAKTIKKKDVYSPLKTENI